MTTTAGKVSSAGRRDVPDLPGALIIGMRNRVAHADFDVYLDTLWDTLADDVPPLAGRIKKRHQD